MAKGTTTEERKFREYFGETNNRLGDENKKFEQDKMVRVPTPEEMKGIDNPPYELWRSRDFIVFLFNDKGFVRISAVRSSINDNGDWSDDITWDELFMLKCSVGFEHSDCVEVFPAVADYVNVSNMRHLWVMNDPIAFKWSESQVEPGTDIGECVRGQPCDGRVIKSECKGSKCNKCGKEYSF
jgi:hypothetical protein